MWVSDTCKLSSTCIQWPALLHQKLQHRMFIRLCTGHVNRCQSWDNPMSNRLQEEVQQTVRHDVCLLRLRPRVYIQMRNKYLISQEQLLGLRRYANVHALDATRNRSWHDWLSVVYVLHYICNWCTDPNVCVAASNVVFSNVIKTLITDTRQG